MKRSEREDEELSVEDTLPTEGVFMEQERALLYLL